MSEGKEEQKKVQSYELGGAVVHVPMYVLFEPNAQGFSFEIIYLN